MIVVNFRYMKMVPAVVWGVMLKAFLDTVLVGGTAAALS
jgi:hypothetical protein